MVFLTHRCRRVVTTFLCLCLALSVVVDAIPVAATTPPPPQQQAATPQSDDASDAPRDCIDPLMASHIAATLVSVLPIPGWSDAADAAAYALNIALKQCPPDLQAPPNLVITQPNQGCHHRVGLPAPTDLAGLVAMDRAIIEEILADPALHLPASLRAAFMAELDKEYGRFTSRAYDSYTNVYGIVLPSKATSLDLPYWNGIGRPTVFHYNSDVLIDLQHPGRRISPFQIEIPVGNHLLRWSANTTISDFDYIPFFVGTSAYRAHKAAQAQATKRFAIDATKGALKKAIEQMLREGNRFFAKEVAKEIAQAIVVEAAFTIAEQIYESTPYYSGGDYTGAQTIALQKLTIVDARPPVIGGVNNLVLEATDPGGMQALRKLGELQAQVTVTDNCDRDPTLTYATPPFWPLLVDANGNPLPSAQIVWRASDDGAASAAGGVNTAEVVQHVTVVDTEPPLLLAPPPVMMYAQPGGVEVPLGSPQTFDIVDLRPTVNYSAPGAANGAQWPIFGAGVHYVQWTATDQSHNTSAPKAQLVNIKAPGANHLPAAISQTGGNTVQAIADVPVKITLRGQDQDVDTAGLRDPIWFNLERHPANGFFLAPLYPYFIDDYRITARYSPQIAAAEGEAFALALAQGPQAMLDYIKDDLCAANIHRTDLPKDFVSFLGGEQKYFAVDDDGYTYIHDQAYRKCTPGGGTIAPTTSPRISVWDPNGLYVGEQEHSGSGFPVRDVKFDIARGYIISVQSDGSSSGNSVVNLSRIQPANAAQPIVDIETYSLWNKVNAIVVNSAGGTRSPAFKNAGKAVWDHHAGVLYVVGDPQQNYIGMAAFTPAPCKGIANSGPDDCLDFLGSQVYSLPIIQTTMLGEFPGVGVDAMKLERIQDIALDSHGNVYLLAKLPDGSSSTFDRIFKFAPAIRHPDGSVTLGDFAGWLGKCDTGANCNYIDHHSIGYACTDTTCAASGPTGGNLPGQLNQAGAIAMDRNDVLYVADTGNERVQRFSPDGLFAGEARSESGCENCSGFVLGAFGAAGKLAVNASHFYVLDSDAELVHIFEASVVHSLDNSSAWVEYKSKSNHVGADSFTFKATDGFRNADGTLVESAPATVAIQIARNFRPPIAVDGYAATQEEVAVPLKLEGYDLDRELDMLTYAVFQPPLHGTLSGTPPNLTYTPAEDFAGSDRFLFTVGDGTFTAEPATFTLEVTPLNDAPAIVPDASALKAGFGHAATLHTAVLDPDLGEVLVATVNWGDGTQQTSGDLASTSGMSPLVLTPLVDDRADLLGYHTYPAAGDYTIQIEVTDSKGTKGTAQLQAAVEPMADLVLERTAKAVVPSVNQPYAYDLVVVNRLSSNQQGVAAGNIQLREVLTGSATYLAATPTTGACQVSGNSFACTLGNLNPNQEIKVAVRLQIDGSASPGVLIALDGSVGSNTPDPLSENNRDRFALAVVPVGDFYVDSQRDGADAAPGDGVCATAAGECTVRAAIMEANALAGAQAVVLGGGVFVLEDEAESAAQRALGAESGDLDIQGDITLIGIGAQQSVLHGNAVDRVLEIHSGKVRLEDLAITGGDAGPQGEGGGIRNGGGDVTLRRVAIDGNRAVNGGGILNAGGAMNIQESSIAYNIAPGAGGGIQNQAQISIENVTISGNQAANGGGLLTVGGSARLLYVTLAGNSASNAGGGINSTGNAVRIENTLLAGNNAPTGPDCASQLESDGHNLIGSAQNCTLAGSTTGNVVGVAAGVDVLTANWAETYSHPVMPDSPAIGQATCLRATDQSGAPRPAAAACTIGAQEHFAVGSTIHLPLISRP